MPILIFVYNNNSDILSSIKRKINSVSYKNDTDCKLYNLIHNKFFIKHFWKNFLNNLSYQKVFFHRKEFKRAHPEYAYLEPP